MLGQPRRYLVACATFAMLLLAASGVVRSTQGHDPPAPDIRPRALVFRGHGYSLYIPAEGERASLQRDDEIGQLAFRWQSGGALPPRTPVYRVVASPTPETVFVPTDVLIAVEVDRQAVFYQPYGNQEVGAADVLLGTVERAERVPCPGYPCSGQREVSRITLAVAQVWQSAQGIDGATLVLLLGDDHAAPAVDSTIVALVHRTAAIPELGNSQSFWVDPSFLYAVTDDHLVPLGDIPADEPLLTVRQAREAVTGIFAGACVTIPPPIPAPATRLPGTPFPTSIPPRRQC